MMGATTTRWLLCLVITTIAGQTAANTVSAPDSHIKQVAIIGMFKKASYSIQSFLRGPLPTI